RSVADEGQERSRSPGPDDRCTGDPDRTVGCPEPARSLRPQADGAVLAARDARQGGTGGRSIGSRRTDRLRCRRRGHRTHHGCAHGAAGGAAGRGAAGGALRVGRPAVTRVAVFGSGSWGTAFAAVLADAGCEAVLHARRREIADAINADRVNAEYLPDLVLPSAVSAT